MSTEWIIILIVAIVVVALSAAFFYSLGVRHGYASGYEMGKDDQKQIEQRRRKLRLDEMVSRVNQISDSQSRIVSTEEVAEWLKSSSQY